MDTNSLPKSLWSWSVTFPTNICRAWRHYSERDKRRKEGRMEGFYFTTWYSTAHVGIEVENGDAIGDLICSPCRLRYDAVCFLQNLTYEGVLGLRLTKIACHCLFNAFTNTNLFTQNTPCGERSYQNATNTNTKNHFVQSYQMVVAFLNVFLASS